MSRSTPEAVFKEAQAAIAQGNWEIFFACLDRTDLLKIAENSFNALFSQPGEAAALAALCREHGFPVETIEALHTQAQEIAESAKSIFNRAGAASGAAVDPETQRQSSLRHQQLVQNYTQTLKTALKSVPNLANFTAALERQMYATIGRGSVSSRLFVDETLHDVEVEGKRAWGARRDRGDWAEDLGFVQKRGSWYIRLLARRAK